VQLHPLSAASQFVLRREDEDGITDSRTLFSSQLKLSCLASTRQRTRHSFDYIRLARNIKVVTELK